MVALKCSEDVISCLISESKVVQKYGCKIEQGQGPFHCVAYCCCADFLLSMLVLPLCVTAYFFPPRLDSSENKVCLGVGSYFYLASCLAIPLPLRCDPPPPTPPLPPLVQLSSDWGFPAVVFTMSLLRSDGLRMSIAGLN